jgi:Cu+-exporting ATPase
MHREYRPDDVHHGDGAALGISSAGLEQGERALAGFTALLGALIIGDVLLGLLGYERSGLAPWPSPAMIAAILGAVYIVYGTLQSLLRGRIGADLALAQACLAALVLGQPFVAAEVVFIALVGEVLEAWTFARTRYALGRLVEQTPRTARVRRGDAELEIPASQVQIGDRVIVLPGERIPVDGAVLAGRSTVDQSALTGESLPIDKAPGDPVYTGTVNQFGAIEVNTEKVGGDTTFGQVLRLVAQARRRKANLEKIADRLARYFLPVVEVFALATLVAGFLAGWPDVWSRTVAVLVVACPCALVLATPAAMLASMAWLARHGVLIKGGSALESLASCDTFAFDKTGTLTLGKPQFTRLIVVGGRDEVDVLRMAACAESASRHPLAAVVVAEARRRAIDLPDPADVTVLPGAGVRARCEPGGEHPRSVLVGNRRLLADQGVAVDSDTEAILVRLDAAAQTALIVAIDGEIAGVIGVHDAIRPEAHDAIHDLRHLKVKEIAVLTGDREPAARAVGKRIHADTVVAELMPRDKAQWIEDRQKAGRRVAMVGDGINDAPALAQADAGIALGGIGADLAAEAGSLIILGDPLRVLPDLVSLARGTVAIIRQNIIGFAFGLNAVAMLSATFGILGPVAAAILHQAGSFLVLLNSMRLLAFGDWAELPPIRQLRDLRDRIAGLDDRVDLLKAWVWASSRWRAIIAAACGVLLLAYGTSGWRIIEAGEVGVLQRFGRYHGVLAPGLHLRWPYPVERVTVALPERVRGLEIGFKAARSVEAGSRGWEARHERVDGDPSEDAALVLTGDGRYVELTATLQYTIDRDDPQSFRRFVFELCDAESALRLLTESAVREVMSRRELLDLLTVGRRDAEDAATVLMRQRVSQYRFGVAVRRVAFLDIHPPLEVLDAYRDVSRSQSDRERRVNEANAHREEVLAEAGGKSQAIVHAAHAAGTRDLAEAAGAADRFASLWEARQYAPELTDFRLFWKTIASSFAGKTKLIFDEPSGSRQHLVISQEPWETAPPVWPGNASARPEMQSQGARPAKEPADDQPGEPKS